MKAHDSGSSAAAERKSILKKYGTYTKHFKVLCAECDESLSSIVGEARQQLSGYRPCLQNLHPRFKSGRRLQFLMTISLGGLPKGSSNSRVSEVAGHFAGSLAFSSSSQFNTTTMLGA